MPRRRSHEGSETIRIRRGSRLLAWVLGLSWLLLAGWSMGAAVSVHRIRAEVAKAGTWISQAEQLRAELATLAQPGNASPVTQNEGPAIPLALREELSRATLLDQAPCDPAVVSAALERWKPAADSFLEGLYERGQAESPEEAVEEHREFHRAATELALTIHEVTREVRSGVSKQSLRLGEHWSALYILTGLTLAASAALFLLVLSWRWQTHQLGRSRTAL